MKIPRTFHQIWLGRQPMPREFLEWRKTWEAINLGWTLKLWDEDSLPPSRWPGLIEKAHGYAQRSNILRYELLCREGGVYVDTDCECLRPIEPLISDCEAFVVRKKSATPRDPVFNNAILGCVPGHPLLLSLVKHLDEVNIGEKMTAGSQYLTLLIAQCPVPIKLIPASLMNPYNHTELKDGKPLPREGFPDAHVLHHWSSKWHPTGFVKLAGQHD